MNSGDHSYLVDDDPIAREAVGELLNSAGFRSAGVGSVGENLNCVRPDPPGWIILDVELLNMSGLEFQAQIAHGDYPPNVFKFQIHRTKVMQKMRAGSLADLVRIAGKLGIAISPTRYQVSRSSLEMKTKSSVVAIVDDDPRLLEALGDLLRSVGHSVRAFTSAKAFLEGEKVSEVDCLITDIDMPQMDGFELQEMANEKRPELPVIFISGKDEVATQQRVKELATGRFFQKPFDSNALLVAITEAIENE